MTRSMTDPRDEEWSLDDVVRQPVSRVSVRPRATRARVRLELHDTDRRLTGAGITAVGDAFERYGARGRWGRSFVDARVPREAAGPFARAVEAIVGVETTDAAQPVRAAATLERHRDGWSWVVARCPFCGRRHSHGGGRLDGDPRHHLGHRVSHCGAPFGEDYELIEADPARTATIIANQRTGGAALRWGR